MEVIAHVRARLAFTKSADEPLLLRRLQQY